MFLECERYANERKVLMECGLLGLGKVRKMCVVEATKVFLEDGWLSRRMNGEHNPQPAVDFTGARLECHPVGGTKYEAFECLAWKLQG